MKFISDLQDNILSKFEKTPPIEINVSVHTFYTTTNLYSHIYNELCSAVQFKLNSKLIDQTLDLLLDHKFKIASFVVNNLYSSLNETFTFLNMEDKLFVSITKDEELTDNLRDELGVSNIHSSPDYNAKLSKKDTMFSVCVGFPLNSNILDSFIKELQNLKIKFELENNRNSIYVFEKDSDRYMNLIPHSIEKFDIDIDKHYNEDFSKFNTSIQEWISDFSVKNKKLVLLHGDPGTGKTNFIKNLLSDTRGIRKIYIPPYFVNSLADPAFFGFIRTYSNSLLIIEDAEKILLSREEGDSGAMSIILNLTDGFLADILNFKIICTFNTDEKNIDTALKRKGRLFGKYKFDKLKKDKTNKLFKELYGVDAPQEEMSLAEIYNPEDNGIVINKESQKSIGFGF